jgi:methylmalonyl-CoA mutase C-terminal domain/subunit
MEKKIRMLLTRHPLDGHEAGYNILATGLREHGIEVILGGAQLPEEIADTAIQEDVDFIGLRNMAGDPVYLVEALFQRLRDKGGDIAVIVGGILRPREVTQLKEMGVAEVFGPGSSIDSIANFVKDYHRGNQASKEKN